MYPLHLRASVHVPLSSLAVRQYGDLAAALRDEGVHLPRVRAALLHVFAARPPAPAAATDAAALAVAACRADDPAAAATAAVRALAAAAGGDPEDPTAWAAALAAVFDAAARAAGAEAGDGAEAVAEVVAAGRDSVGRGDVTLAEALGTEEGRWLLRRCEGGLRRVDVEAALARLLQ
jgi:hypothetical protein